MDSKQLHVLVVEDHEINLEMICEMLNRLGCKVDTAQNGLEAVCSAKNQLYDAIFMDLQMPEMDGYEAARQIRLCSISKKTPIFGLTANHVKKDLQRCLDSGMNDYLTKPFVLSDLEALLQKHIK